MNFGRILLSVFRIALKCSVEERQMLTKAHSNLSKDPILQDIQCFLGSTEHSQLTALITIAKLGLGFQVPAFLTKKNPSRKRNVILQFLLSSLLAAHRPGGQKQLLSPLPRCSSEHSGTPQSTESRSFYCH